MLYSLRGVFCAEGGNVEQVFVTKMCLFLKNADQESEVAASCLTYGTMLYVGGMEGRRSGIPARHFFHMTSSFQCNPGLMDSGKVCWHLFICDSLFHPSARCRLSGSRSSRHLSTWLHIDPAHVSVKSFPTVWISGRRWGSSQGQREESDLDFGVNLRRRFSRFPTFKLNLLLF